MMRILRVLAIVFVACVSNCLGDDSTAVPQPLWQSVKTQHSSYLDVIDRVRVSRLSLSDGDGDASSPQPRTYLVLPAPAVGPDDSAALGSQDIRVTSLDSRMLFGMNVKRMVDDWRSLDIHRYGSHGQKPTCGLEFFRGKTLMFKVSICEKSRTIALPTIDPTTGNGVVAVYGFDESTSAERLLNVLRRLMPHPRIQNLTRDKL